MKNHVVVHNSARLSRISSILKIPIIATRHVFEKFGDIDNQISSIQNPYREVFDKYAFSMVNK
jgi:hypothetical protein